MEFNRIYFYTATIKDWIPLLKEDQLKDIIINSLKYLIDKKKIVLYGFVLMPNHIHLIWEQLEMNRNESPQASLMKFTAHKFLEFLQNSNSDFITNFKVENNTREYQFWKRESLNVDIYSPSVIYQKLDYVHNNPTQGKWMLNDSPIAYKYSSAYFYETGEDKFKILTHIGVRL